MGSQCQWPDVASPELIYWLSNLRLSMVCTSVPSIAIAVDSLYQGIYLQSPQAHSITLLWGEIAKYQVIRTPVSYIHQCHTYISVIHTSVVSYQGTQIIKQTNQSIMVITIIHQSFHKLLSDFSIKHFCE